MKRFLISVFVVLSIIFLNSCTPGCGNPIEMAATEFIGNMKDGKVWEAKQYCTAKVKDFIDSCVQESVNINITNLTDVKGTWHYPNDSAVVSFCCIDGIEAPEFKMVKQKGKWLVDDLSLILKK